MERVSPHLRRSNLILFSLQWGIVLLIAAVLLAASSPPLFAGVLLVPPAGPLASNPDERFSESRFGFPPRLPDLKAQPTPSAEGLPSSSSLMDSQFKLTENQRSGIQEVALIVGDLGFFPKVLFVTQDIPVKLFVTGASKKSLCLILDAFQIKKQVRSQKVEEMSFTPTTAGQYRFYCPINGMEGTLLVREQAAKINKMDSERNPSSVPASAQGLLEDFERKGE